MTEKARDAREVVARPIDPVAAAITWAVFAHTEQEYPGLGDRAPQPYIRHVLRVVLGVNGEAAQVVAALHDVLEDTNHYIPPWVTDAEREAVNLVTWHESSEPYEAYIDRIVTYEGDAGEIARHVKLADLLTNLDHDPDGILRKRPKYEAARDRILAALRPPESERGEARYTLKEVSEMVMQEARRTPRGTDRAPFVTVAKWLHAGWVVSLPATEGEADGE